MGKDKPATFYSSMQQPATICTLNTHSHNVCQMLQVNTTVCELSPPPIVDGDVPMDTSVIDFDVPGDGPGDKPIEVEAEPEEPVPGVHCVPKPKAK